jgi:VIT1/CCC1 family predicted Fe2+/Mn2+ transporter
MNAFKNSLVTFFSFAIFGLMPLIPVIVAYTHHSSVTNAYFAASIVVSAFFLFILGFSKSFVTGIKWYISVIETIIIGAVAAGVAYGIGRALE